MLRVELPQLARRSEAHARETVQGDGSFIDTLISLLCGILCNNEQYNKIVGKALSGNLVYIHTYKPQVLSHCRSHFHAYTYVCKHFDILQMLVSLSWTQ